MNQSRISVRYAKALFLLAKEKKMLEEVYSDIKIVEQIFTESQEINVVLNNISMPNSKKFDLISVIFKNFNQITIDFLKLLIRKDRQSYILNITRNFSALYRKEKNILLLKTNTAIKLNPKIKKSILTIFEEAYKSEFELIETVNKDIIGGIILKIENRELNMSVKKQLADIKQALISEEYSK